jgi:exonuclease V gamma subunit
VAHVVGHAAAGQSFYTDIIGKKPENKNSEDPWALYQAPLSHEMAMEILAKMLELYERGCREKLPFAPDCSYTFVDSMAKGKTKDDALVEAYDDAWATERFPEADDPYLFEAWGDDGPMAHEKFGEVAEAFWGKFVTLLSSGNPAGGATDQGKDHE